MRIIWVAKKPFDIAPDRTTWLEMIRSLQDEGHQVTLYTYGLGAREDFGFPSVIRYLPVIRIPGLIMLSFWIVLYLLLVWEALFRRPEVVILDLYTFWCGFPFDLLGRLGLSRTQFVLDIRSTINEGQRFGIFDAFGGLLTSLGLRYTKFMLSGITTITPQLRDYLVDLIGIDPEAIGIWSSGVDEKRFDPLTVQPTPRPEGWETCFLVFYHGYIANNRGLYEAVEAMNLVRQTHPEIRLMFLGNGLDQEALADRITELSLQENVLLLQSVPYEEVAAYVATGDVALMAYPDTQFWRTSSPIKLLEYMAMGKPVLLRDIPVFHAFTENTQCAFFLPDNDPQTICSAIIQVYDQRNSLPELGETGRQRVIQHYTWRAQAHNLGQYLEQLVTTKDSGIRQ